MIIIPVRIDVTMLMHPTYWDLFDIDIVVVGGLSPKPPVVLLPPPGTGLLAFRTAGGVPAPASVPPVLVLHKKKKLRMNQFGKWRQGMVFIH